MKWVDLRQEGFLESVAGPEKYIQPTGSQVKERERKRIKKKQEQHHYAGQEHLSGGHHLTLHI